MLINRGKWRGVNLGGWLVLERWIAPSLFQGLSAQDETSFCLELGDKKGEVLRKHRETFITEDDFEWIARHGLNAVRIPVPHWIFGDIEPYVGCVEYLDFAIQTAEQYKLAVLIDLHTAPGSQNGWDHSGLIGKVNWHKDRKNIDKTLEALEWLAERYANYENLIGFELLNEPNPSIPHKALVDFYEEGYQKVRRHLDDNKKIVVSDAFRPLDWHNSLSGSDYKNVAIDAHLFQAFTAEDRKMDLQEHLDKSAGWKNLIDGMQKTHPVLVGEWSLGLPPRAIKNMNETKKLSALQAYGRSQLDVFEDALGWFFFTYKTEDQGGWNLRHSVENGWLQLM